MLTIVSYDKAKISSSEHYEYDIYGNPVKRKIYDTMGNVDYEYAYEYIYDAHHNFTRRSEYRNGRPFSITERVITYQ